MIHASFLTGDVVGAAGASLIVAVVVMALLRHETRLPWFISVLLVPPIVTAGFVLAVYLHLRFSLAMAQSAGVLAGLLIPAALLYELIVDPA